MLTFRSMSVLPCLRTQLKITITSKGIARRWWRALLLLLLLKGTRGWTHLRVEREGRCNEDPRRAVHAVRVVLAQAVSHQRGERHAAALGASSGSRGVENMTQRRGGGFRELLHRS